jgi:hypothetical protein
MIELQTSVKTSKQDDTTRTRTPKPGYLKLTNVSTGGQTWKHLRKHRESQMFPQQCFLVCPGL